jgi:hypothetical protein
MPTVRTFSPNVHNLLEIQRAFQDLSILVARSTFDATTYPTPSDDITQGWRIGSRWLDVNTDQLYVCVDNTEGAAIWRWTGLLAEGPDGGAHGVPGGELIRMDASGTALEGSGVLVDGSGNIVYTPAVPDDWEDTDPTTVVGALDRVAGGHAGVCLVSDTQPTTPGTGQVWLDTAATGTGGSGVLTVHTITADATLTASQTVILCDATTGAITVTLPAASANAGRRYFVKKIDSSANTVTIDGNASETIDGDLTATLSLQYEAVLVVCDSSNWHIL